MMSTYAQGSAASWAITIHQLTGSFLKYGHDPYLLTTNGIRGVPKDLLKYFKDCPDPDIEFTYCTPNNYPHRFSGTLANTKRAKLRVGIFNYESSILPSTWAECHKYVDYILPSSQYCADIFLRAGIPEEKIIVMPLGVDFDALSAPVDAGFAFKTKKKFKLLNISIPHARKNIDGLIDAYFDEFNADDDICLILKTSLNANNENFEVNVMSILDKLKTKYSYKKIPEIEICEHRFENMATIYKKSDALICSSVAEGWWLPGLEGMYCGTMVASPRYGGQLDFLEHNKNCLLIDTVEARATPQMQYWEANPNAVVGYPEKKSMQNTMRKMYYNKEDLHSKFDMNMKQTVEKFTWDNAAKVILDLYNGITPVRTFGELI